MYWSEIRFRFYVGLNFGSLGSVDLYLVVYILWSVLGLCAWFVVGLYMVTFDKKGYVKVEANYYRCSDSNLFLILILVAWVLLVNVWLPWFFGLWLVYVLNLL